MKKKVIIYVSLIMFLLILCVSNLISYADNTDKIYVNLKPAKEDGTGYALTDVPPGKRIWELAQYTSVAGTTRVTTPKELYCIKASYGKTWETDQNTDGVVEYNRNYNFNDGESILNNFTSNSATTVLSELLKGDTYKEISWLLDNFYIPGDDDSSETQKTNYLVNAGIPVDDIDNSDNEYFWKFDLDERVVLSQDEIVAIQKAVIWYFTNGGTFYDFTSSDGSWLYKTIDGGASYKSQDALTSKERAECKQKEIQTLYNYLIDSAKQAAQNNYTSSSSSVTVDKGSVTKQSSNGNYIIGPIKLVGTATSSTTITMNVTNQSGTAITNYTIVDKSGNTISSTLKELVGKTEGFYIKVPKTGIQQVNIEIVVKSATATQKTLWVKGTDQNGKVALDGEQPLVEISREETTDKTNITVDTSEFDLSLRKYITAVSKDETIDNSDYLKDSNGKYTRAPSIITTNLGKTDTTAIYNHRKDPVQVESGNYVQYAITIFNEGNIDGYASQIVDQLPEGLICYDSLNPQKIQSVGPDGKIRNTYTITNISPEGNSTTANRIIFDIDKENAKNLSAYGTTLDYETITFKCKVTKTPDVDNQKILTNVAWISADSNAKNLSDIDSQPSTVPNGTDGKTVNQGNIENYIGNTSNKTDLTDSNYYYKGYQDDDDFEKLVILPDSRVFDLALRKNIISVTTNGTITELKNDSSRIPTVDTTKLDNKTSTTADYKHKKDPVVVKEGSTVKYRITIYNEGDIAGRATKIVDQLPTGLKFLRVTSGNFVESTDATEVAELNNNNKLTLVRKSDNTTNLKAYETGKTIDSEIIEIECEVTAVADENNDKILTNIAWIASEVDERGKSKDRDSEAKTPDTIYNKDQLVTSDNGYTGKNTETDLTNKNHYYEGQEDDDDFEKIVIKPINGNYNVVLVKEDASGEQLDSKATFEVNGVEKEVIGKLTIAENVKITRENAGTADIYTIKETKAPDGYCEFNGTITITVNKKQEDNKYIVDSVTYKVTDKDGKDITSTSKEIDNIYLSDDGNIYVKIKNYQFDLKLIKRIVEVNGEKVPERIQKVDVSKLNTRDENGKLITTGDYTLDKTPVAVKKGDIVKYTFRIYNEGNIDGYAAEITEDIPDGLEFIWNEKSGDELKADTTLTEAEKEAIAFNQSQLWAFKKTDINATTGKIEMITTDYLSKDREAVDENLIKAFDSKKGYIDTDKEKNPDYKEVSVMLKVVSDDVSGKVIRNEACISKDTDKNGNEVDDRDSKPEEWPGREPDHKYEDDEDYDNVILSTFDIALRKFIVATGKNEKIEKKDYLTNSDGTYQREPVVDTSKLNTVGEDGKLITTAIYNHTKEPILVQKGDYVVYCLRVYNEGSTDGYAAEVKDYLPEYLEFVNGEFNDKYGWKVSEDGRVVTTSYLSSDKYLIKAAQTVDGKIKLNYQDIMILCKVKDTAITGEKVTNIAEISKYEDKKHETVDDRDSGEGNVKVPTDKDLPSYKDNESGNYIPGQEDDDDFEKIIIKKFDLALRKFITKVQENDVTTRIPQVKYKDGKISYEHTKDPITLHVNDVVIYTIRVYNEGEIDGYASEISDDIPEYLEYLPEDSTNKEYKWVMYNKDGKETDKVEEATKLKTTYLSKENEKKNGEYLLKAFDGNVENISYHDVKIAFKVKDPNSNTYIITNHAQISDDTDKNGKEIDDIDSKTDEWIEGEDDQDVEHVKVEYFDLSLLKYVTKVIVEENGKQQITETGYNGLEDPEPVVKVELKRKKLNEVVVKFGYGIKITNEGDIAGYAKEITDYIPEGLKFVAEDNPDWKDEGNNVISTRKLENTLLQPGESATVEVILTWINGADNLAEKTNTAEISEDHNEYDVPDRDSTPDNQVPGEDDIDIAKVILLISTGTVQTYFALTLGLLAIVFVGVFLIKKFVL